MKRLTTHLLLMAGILLSTNATANFTTQNAKGVVITFLDGADSLATATNATTQSILSKALSLKGIKYRYGGSSPKTGFDCSGFVNYVFNQAANVKLPRTTRGLSRISKTIKKQELVPGDLVFFNTRRRAFSHVGIYMGDGDFIHAPRTGRRVSVESMKTGYWKQRFNGGKRVKEVN